MATVPPKHHQPLHNFSLPFLKWGQRIQLNNNCRRRHHRHRNLHANATGNGNGNYPTTDSSESDLNNPGRSRTTAKTEIDEENNGVLGKSSGKLVDVDVASVANNGGVKPWNLRPRRFVNDAVDGNGAVASSAKAGRSARGVAAATATAAAAEEEDDEHGKKRRLWISLSKEEIEEDVYAFTGARPSRRPKKRNKIAQKQVDNVFPGLYLVGISADSYRV